MAAGDLLGRIQERAAIEAFVERGSAAPETLVIEGEPGIGKTTLWREATRLAEARGMQVLACRPTETETKLSFSALADLLEPVPEDVFEDLPAPQRRAIEVALLEADPEGAPPEPRAVATAFRSVLTRLATSPVLIAIDDAQWLDRSSAGAIDFALRRRAETPLSLLVASRPPGATLNVLADAARITLGPLSLGAVHELLKNRLGRTLPRPLLLRVHEAAEGNPFYTLEVGQEALQLGVRPGDPLPVPKDLSELLRRRVGRFPKPTRTALLVAALLGEPSTDLISAVLESDGVAALEPAERAGIVVTEGPSVRFSHPLFASAVHASASRLERRRLHEQIAETVDDREERGRHLALAATGPDASLAAALDEAAAAAKARGALDAAAELTEYAVRFTPAHAAGEAAERSLQLGIALRLAGDTERADAVLDQLAGSTTGSIRAQALYELAAVRYWTQGAPAGLECCERALEAARGDLALEAKVFADLAVYCDVDLERSHHYARAALQLFDQLGDAADPLAHSEALAIAAMCSLMLGLGLPLAELDRALEVESKATETSEAVGGRITTASGRWLKYVDDFDGARARLEHARRAATEGGDESALPNILVHLAQTELWSGNWELASRYAEEACEIAEQLGYAYGGPPALRALVDAHLGRVDRARTAVTAGLEAGASNPLTECFYARALGFLDLSLGDVEAASRHLTRALELMESVRIREPGVLRIHADVVEALIAAGELEAAGKVLVPWEEQARRIELAWSLATSARCRALLETARGRADDAVCAIDDALAVHERFPMPFELARTLLVKGRIERRAKRKAAAKESLEQALAIFERLPAPLWAEKARNELARVGLRRAPDDLTETERRVAELAASGLTNREVAAQLFLSPKTVEANLARAYRKLGIRSRAELGARLAGVGSDRPQT
jgi:DNA-binding CsgD family transcriptional regulator